MNHETMEPARNSASGLPCLMRSRQPYRTRAAGRVVRRVRVGGTVPGDPGIGIGAVVIASVARKRRHRGREARS